jgi:hypothetical protein
LRMEILKRMRTACQINPDSHNAKFRERYQQSQMVDLPVAKKIRFFWIGLKEIWSYVRYIETWLTTLSEISYRGFRSRR